VLFSKKLLTNEKICDILKKRFLREVYGRNEIMFNFLVSIIVIVNIISLLIIGNNVISLATKNSN